MKLSLRSLSLVATLFAAPLAAQNCSDLSVTGDGSPGTNLTISVTGSAADAFTFLAVGQDTGTTTVNLGPLLSFDLGIASPLVPLPLGVADANGDVSISLDLPTGDFPRIDVYGQALAISFEIGQGRPTLTACVSDVEAFGIGSSN